MYNFHISPTGNCKKKINSSKSRHTFCSGSYTVSMRFHKMCIRNSSTAEQEKTHLNNSQVCSNLLGTDGYFLTDGQLSHVVCVVDQINLCFYGQAQNPKPIRMCDFDSTRNNDIFTIGVRPANYSLGNTCSVQALPVSRFNPKGTEDFYFACAFS